MLRFTGSITLTLSFLLISCSLSVASAQEERKASLKLERSLDEEFPPIHARSTSTEDTIAAFAQTGERIQSYEPEKLSMTHAYAFLVETFHLPRHTWSLLPRYVELMQHVKKGEVSSVAQNREHLFSGKGVVQHLRFEEGKLLPSSEDLRSDLLTVEQRKLMGKILGDVVRNYQLSENSEKQLDRQSEKLLQSTSARELPVCIQSKTYRMDKPQSSDLLAMNAQGKEHEIDYLILRSTSPDVTKFFSDVDELFGRSTNISRYSTKIGDRLSVIVSGGNVGCLPFRMRISEKYIYRHYGDDALKNYDLDKKGVLHPVIQRSLDEFF